MWGSSWMKLPYFLPVIILGISINASLWGEKRLETDKHNYKLQILTVGTWYISEALSPYFRQQEFQQRLMSSNALPKSKSTAIRLRAACNECNTAKVSNFSPPLRHCHKAWRSQIAVLGQMHRRGFSVPAVSQCWSHVCIRRVESWQGSGGKG